MSQVVKWFILNDRKRFKRWALRQLQQDRPVMLIPAHGELAESADLSERLDALIRDRL